MTSPEMQRRAIRRTKKVYYAAQMLFWLSVSLPLALSILLIQARGLDLLEIGLLLGVYTATVVVLEVPSRGLADTIGRKRITLLAYAFLLLSSLAFSFPAFLAFYVLNGVGRAFASGALQAWFIDHSQAADPEIDLQPPLARAGTFELSALTVGTLLGSYLPVHLTCRRTGQRFSPRSPCPSFSLLLPKLCCPLSSPCSSGKTAQR